MIISASRRTDIPAFYSDWFINRLRDGFVCVRNPFNQNQISNIKLSSDIIECIVFWTKNPANMIKKLREIDSMGYKYYFQFTLTAYDKKIEKNVPDKCEIIRYFKELSEYIGNKKVIWRYDPILMTDNVNEKHHINCFNYFATELKGYTQKCIVSFLDMYKKCKKNMKALNLTDIDKVHKLELLRKLRQIADDNGIKVETCAEEIELGEIGIPHGKCIDDHLISEIIGEDIHIEKDPSQRNECGCVTSIDIGSYNTCKHNCIYCYANYSLDSVKKNIREHDVNSALLIGQIKGCEKIDNRKMVSYRNRQLNLF